MPAAAETAARPAGTALTSPIALLDRRLRELSPGEPHRYGVTEYGSAIPAQGGRWFSAGDPEGVLAAMLSAGGVYLSVSAAVAGARMAGSLGYAAAGRLAVAIAVTGRAYDTGPGSLLLRLDDEGLVQRIAVRNPTLRTTALSSPDPRGPDVSSPDPRGPDVSRADPRRPEVMPDLDALLGWAAGQAWATLDPLVDELHRVTRYGRVPIWNLIADTVLGPATTALRPLSPARPGPAEAIPTTTPALARQRAARAIGTAFIDRLIGCGAPIRRRGTAHEEMVDGESLLTPVRGSCCLHFRLGRDRCQSCPLATR